VKDDPIDGPIDEPTDHSCTERGQTMSAPMHRTRGFTLIEVLIVVVIIGILAAIAVPSYAAYMTQVRRSDATILLTEAAGEQFRYFSEFNAYTDELTELGYALDTAVPSADGHYTLSAVASDPSRFVLTATPVVDGLQAGDAECGSFTLNQNGVRATTGGGENCW